MGYSRVHNGHIVRALEPKMDAQNQIASHSTPSDDPPMTHLGGVEWAAAAHIGNIVRVLGPKKGAKK